MFVLGIITAVLLMFSAVYLYQDNLKITCISRYQDIFYNEWQCPTDVFDMGDDPDMPVNSVKTWKDIQNEWNLTQ